MSLFKQVLHNRVPRNAFDLSHERKFSLNMGDLVPILCEEVVPGDEFKMNTEVLLRMAPMVSPVMHRVNVYTHFFFVPNRLVWDNWQTFITGGEDGEDASVFPYIQQTLEDTGLAAGSLADYLGYSVGDPQNVVTQMNALPFRAYGLIYNEYYRDQWLQTAGNVSKDDGLDLLTDMDVKKRCWEKDYFTSALPYLQKGGEVTVPLGSTSAPVVLTNLSGANPVGEIRSAATGNLVGSGDLQNDMNGLMNSSGTNSFYDPNGGLSTDLSSVTIGSVNDLRRATRLQMWLERNARSGSRYIESILAHFGVLTEDYRLQRPEYLGGGKSPVVISEVLQTAETTVTSPLGNMAGHGIAAGNSHSFAKKFNEHGFVIGIMSVLPKTAYSQGYRRFFVKTDKFDYFWPEFAQLGEQPVYRNEIWNALAPAQDTTFGYQSRYAEYKFIPSTVHGDFKTTLDFWHLGRLFASAPSLNAAFVESDPADRIFADTGDSHKLWCQIFNNVRAIRPMPQFNVPTL